MSEALGFSKLSDYTTGGCIHIVVNNQIGFTTTPMNARSGVHCTGRLSRILVVE